MKIEVTELPEEIISRTCFPAAIETLLEEEGVGHFYVAGGSILSQIKGQIPSDYDIYPTSKEVALSIVEKLDSNGTAVMVTDRAITYNCSGEIVQVCYNAHEYPNSLEELFAYFDFTVCMAAWSSKDEKFYAHKTFLNDVLQGRIEYNKGTLYPFASLGRLSKYTQKGYTVSTRTILAMAMNALDKEQIESWDQLKESIGGAYGSIDDAINTEIEFSFENAVDALLSSEYQHASNHIYGFNIFVDVPKFVSFIFDDSVLVQHPEYHELFALDGTPHYIKEKYHANIKAFSKKEFVKNPDVLVNVNLVTYRKKEYISDNKEILKPIEVSSASRAYYEYSCKLGDLYLGGLSLHFNSKDVHIKEGAKLYDAVDNDLGTLDFL